MVQVNKERLINRFIELVKIDSETRYEANFAEYLKRELVDLGLIVKEDHAKSLTDHEANNLICTLKGTNFHSHSIFFSSHMDTVTPGKSINPQIINNYIVSDGSTILGADDKAGIAVIFELIHLIKENNINHGDIQFIFTVGEESGLAGAKVIDRSLIHADFGFVLDSDEPVGNLVVAAPYQTKFTVTIHGKSAHSGVAPEKGISAITTAAKAIAKMKLGRIDEETTANISYFKGGKKSQTNIVTDYVIIEGEARSIRKDKLERVTSEIKHYFSSTTKMYGAKSEIEFIEMYPGFSINHNHEVVKIAQRAAEKLQLPCQLLASGGGSDANIFNSFGVPTVNLSIGYEHIHTTNERIHVDELIRLAKLSVEIVKQSFQ